MDNIDQMEIEILTAIRNNQTVPADDFYKLFENCWSEYRENMAALYHKELFIISRHDTIPGLNRLELTGKGKLRIADLLYQRSNDLSKKLSEPKKAKKARTFPALNSILRIGDFVSHFSVRAKRQAH
jgi:hypothetical protein